MTDNKNQQIIEILSLMQERNITLQDLQKNNASQSKTAYSQSRLILFLSYLGGLIVFAGVVLAIQDNWQSMGSFERIIITYGMGLLLLVLAFILYARKTSPAIYNIIFTISNVLQFVGLLVANSELFPTGGDITLSTLIISFIMLVQSLFIWRYTKSTPLLFLSVSYAALSYISLIYYLLDHNLIKAKTWIFHTDNILVVVGSISCLVIAYLIQKSVHYRIANFFYFIGSLILYLITFNALEANKLELFEGLIPLIGLTACLYTKNKVMLVTTGIALIAFIFRITYKYFAHTPWWPLALIVVGLIVIGITLLLYKRIKATN